MASDFRWVLYQLSVIFSSEVKDQRSEISQSDRAVPIYQEPTLGGSVLVSSEPGQWVSTGLGAKSEKAKEFQIGQDRSCAANIILGYCVSHLTRRADIYSAFCEQPESRRAVCCGKSRNFKWISWLGDVSSATGKPLDRGFLMC